jgi:hypothetical protein
MDRKAKPIPKTGERNIYCPYYGSCLDYAVDHSWESCNCSVCGHNVGIKWQSDRSESGITR